MFVIAETVAIICFVTALLDVGMNGARYAEWAPWGLGLTAVSGVVMYFS